MHSIKLRTLPLQLIDVEEGVLLKRGNTILNVNGQGAKSAVPLVLSSFASPGSTQEEVLEKFSQEDRHAASQFIAKLISNRLVIPADASGPFPPMQESHLDIFYWHFGESTTHVNQRFNRERMIIIGANHISRQLSSALTHSGVDNFEIVDDPLLANTRLLHPNGSEQQDMWPGSHLPRPLSEWEEQTDPDSISCLIATSDIGGGAVLQKWNRFCVKNNICFLPVLLQDQIGYVGPLVIPGETACLECLLARQKSHRANRFTAQWIEESAFEGQSVVGFHPSMASILGDMAAMELTKFFSGILGGRNVGIQIEINLLSARMIPRKVLKVPRCPVCSPLITRPPANPNKTFSFHPLKDHS